MFKWFSSLKKWEKSAFLIFCIIVILLFSTVIIDFSRHKNFYQPFFYEEKEDYEKTIFDIEFIKIKQEHGITPDGRMDIVKSEFYILNIPVDTAER